MGVVPTKKATNGILESHSEVEGQKFPMSSGRVVLSSSVGGTDEWSCESPVDIALDVGEIRAKEIKIQEGLKSFHILLTWVFRLDEREDEGAVSDRLCDGRSMRWADRWRQSTKCLSKEETYCGRVAQ